MPSDLPIKHNNTDYDNPHDFDPEKGAPTESSSSTKYGRPRLVQDPRLPNPGGRICDVLPHLKSHALSDDSDGSSDILLKQIEAESGNDLKYRTCGWKRVRPFEAKNEFLIH